MKWNNFFLHFQTNGVFNPAKEIITRMEKQKQASNIGNDDDDD